MRGTGGSLASTRNCWKPSRAVTARRQRRSGRNTWASASRACRQCAPPSGGEASGSREGWVQGTVHADETNVFPRFLDLAYPNIERGKGVWLETTDGHRVLDACSGGAMVACLGHGVSEIAEAAAQQADQIAYFYNHHFTNRPQEELADRVIGLVPEMARIKFASGGSEANETAMRLARAYHVDRGQRERWRIISPAQAYHGSTLGTLALTGRRRSLQEPYAEYMPAFLHIPPSTPRFDPSGQAAL